MGKIQKIFWWVVWYWITLIGLGIFLGILFASKILPDSLLIFLTLATLSVPGWYATRKVKQKAREKEMEQRSEGTMPATKVSTATQPVANTRPPEPTVSPISQRVVSKDSGTPMNRGTAQQAEKKSEDISPTEKLPNLNEATVEALAELSGINRILASKIITVRTKDGKFSSFEDLFSRVQLSPQVQHEIRNHFSLIPSQEGRIIDF